MRLAYTELRRYASLRCSVDHSKNTDSGSFWPLMIVLRVGVSRLKTQGIRSVAGLILLLAFFTPRMQMAEDVQASEVVQKVAEAEKGLPWFWSPPVEGLADIPFTYESKQTRRLLDHRGKEVLSRKTSRGFFQPWRSVHMERIALDEGSYYRCLVQDGISPCSEELMQALERDSQKREHFTSEDRARIRNIREERYRRHRRFWTEFPEALLFERIGSNEIHFEPRRNYQATDAPPTTVLANMTGRFWFDPLTYEITKMEYELLGDAANPVVPLSKGASPSSSQGWPLTALCCLLACQCDASSLREEKEKTRRLICLTFAGSP